MGMWNKGGSPCNFLPFEEARSVVRSLHIKNSKEYDAKCRSGGLDVDLFPIKPSQYYKRRGQWTDWYDWLGIHKDRRKNTVNDNYFKKWSDNMAYILGFWWADGNIYKNKFNISQHFKYKKLLVEIQKEMDMVAPIYVDKASNNLRIQVTSKEIVKDIKKIGGSYRKSKLKSFPCIPSRYFPCFVKGLWDGDGSVWFCKTSKVYMSSIVGGNRIFMGILLDELRSNINGLKGNIREKRKIVKIGDKVSKGIVSSYELYLGRKDTIRLAYYFRNAKTKIGIFEKEEKFKKAIIG